MMKSYNLTGKMIALTAAIAFSAPMHAFGDNGTAPKVKSPRALIEGENFVHMMVTSGFNEDIVANGIGPLSASVTNDADNSNYVFISRGLQLSESAAPITFGLPANGLINNMTSPHTYQLASYTGNNTLRLFAAGSQGMLQFSNAQSLTKLFLLVTSSGGANISGTIHFTDGTTQELGTSVIPSWFDQTGLPKVATGIGRGRTTNNELNNFGDAPNLFQLQVAISEANQSKMVSGVTVIKNNGGTVFNLMGATGLLVTQPIANSQSLTVASGYNQDIIASGVGTLSSLTTSDVDGFNYAFLAQGFQTTVTDTPITFGLPQNGLIDNISQGPNYQLAPYSANNTLRLNTGTLSGTVMFTTPVATESVYLLATSSNGATVDFTLRFSDGTTQEPTNVAVPGWFANTRSLETVATALGRGNITTGGIESFVNAPNLFQIVIPVVEANQAKQLEGITATMQQSASVFNLMAVSAVLETLSTNGHAMAKASVYPNPVNDVLTVTDTDSLKNISVYNLSGQLVKEENINMSQVSFSDMATGVYFVKLTASNGSFKTIKVVKI
jgi:hypothetical protein